MSLKLISKFALVLVVLIGATWGGLRYVKNKTKPAIVFGTVAKGDLTQRVTISGFIVPAQTVNIAAPYDGYLQKLFINVGQKVKQGDPIATVTITPDGKNEGAVYPLRAPFDGKVVHILKHQGANVVKDAGEEKYIARIDDLSKLYIESDTPEIDYPKLKIGQDVVIKATSMPGKSFEGKVISLFEASKATTRWDRSRVEFPIRVEIVKPTEDLKPGMSVTMDIITSEAQDVLVLRHDFIGKKDNEYFIVDEKGEKHPVIVGMRSDEAFEVKSGVSENQKVQQVDFLSEGGRAVSTGGGGKGRKRGH